MQLFALCLGQRRQKVVLDLARQRPQPAECALPFRRQLDDVPPPVLGIALSLEQTTLLELVEEADELAPVVPERVRDRALRLARAFAQDEQDRVVVRVQSGRLVRRHAAVLGRKAEALEQEGGGGHQLLRQPGGRRKRRGRLRSGDAHDRKSSAPKRWCGITLTMSTIMEVNW